jgi:ribosomal protein L11 methyltransferase
MADCLRLRKMPNRSWPALKVRFKAPSTDESTQFDDRLAAVLADFTPRAIQQSDDWWLVVFDSPDARALAAAGLPTMMAGLVAVDSVEVADEHWAERSQRSLGAVDVGRVTVTPPWSEPAVGAPGRDGGHVTIVIQPSMGFGTGHHATTRLCLALIQRLDLSGRSVLDAGTGSGVLALAACALGAAAVVAVDNDPDAIESARENLALNGVRDRIDLHLGDFRTLPAARFDVVVANLTGGLLVLSADVLARAVAPRGALLVSGVTLEEEAQVLAAFAPWMAVAERLTEDEWMAAHLRLMTPARPSAPARAPGSPLRDLPTRTAEP